MPWLERMLLHHSKSILIQSLHSQLQLRPEVSRQITSLTSLLSLFHRDNSTGDTADITLRARKRICNNAMSTFALSQKDGTIDAASMHGAARYSGLNMLFIGLVNVKDWTHIAGSANTTIDASLAILGPFDAPGWKDTKQDAEQFRSKCSKCVVLIGESAAIPLVDICPGFTVRGAGDPEFDGKYLLDGETNGRPKYRKVGGSKQTCFYDHQEDWVLGDENDDQCAYYAESHLDEPPMTKTWKVIYSGVSPAPSLARGGRSSLSPGNIAPLSQLTATKFHATDQLLCAGELRADDVQPWLTTTVDVPPGTKLVCEWWCGYVGRNGSLHARAHGTTEWVCMTAKAAPLMRQRLALTLPDSVLGGKLELGYQVSGGGHAALHVVRARLELRRSSLMEQVIAIQQAGAVAVVVVRDEQAAKPSSVAGLGEEDKYHSAMFEIPVLVVPHHDGEQARQRGEGTRVVYLPEIVRCYTLPQFLSGDQKVLARMCAEAKVDGALDAPLVVAKPFGWRDAEQFENRAELDGSVVLIGEPLLFENAGHVDDIHSEIDGDGVQPWFVSSADVPKGAWLVCVWWCEGVGAGQTTSLHARAHGTAEWVCVTSPQTRAPHDEQRLAVALPDSVLYGKLELGYQISGEGGSAALHVTQARLAEAGSLVHGEDVTGESGEAKPLEDIGLIGDVDSKYDESLESSVQPWFVPSVEHRESDLRVGFNPSTTRAATATSTGPWLDVTTVGGV
jgi:hypothetical protein